MASAVAALPLLHAFAEESGCPTAVSIMDRLLDPDRPVLAHKAWKRMAAPVYLASSNLEPLQSALRVFSAWFGRVFLSPEADVDQLRVDIVNGFAHEHKRAQALLDTLGEAATHARGQLEPAKAVLERTLEQCGAMDQLGDFAPNAVLLRLHPTLVRRALDPVDPGHTHRGGGSSGVAGATSGEDTDAEEPAAGGRGGDSDSSETESSADESEDDERKEPEDDDEPEEDEDEDEDELQAQTEDDEDGTAQPDNPDEVYDKQGLNRAQRRALFEWIHAHHGDCERYLRQRTLATLAVEAALEHYLLALVPDVLALALADFVQAGSAMADLVAQVRSLAADFLGSALPLIRRAFNFDPELIQSNLLPCTVRGIPRVPATRVLRRFFYKLRVFDSLLNALDVFLFPRSVHCHSGGVKSLMLSRTTPDCVLTAGYDRLIRVWNLSTQRCLAQFAGHDSIVTWAAFTTNDKFVVSASADGTARLWKVRSAKCVRRFVGHTNGIADGDLSGDSCLLLTASMDSTVRLWDVASGRCFRVFRGHGKDTWVKAVAFTHRDTMFVSAGLDRRLVLWSLSQQAVAPVRAWDAHADYILDVAVIRRSYVLTTAKDQSVRMWNLDTGQERRGFMLPSWAATIAKSRDESLFAVVSFDNRVTVCNANTGAILRCLHVHNEGVIKAIFNKDASAVIVATSDGNVQVLPL